MYTRLQPILFVRNLPSEVAFYQCLGFYIAHQEPNFIALAADDILFGLMQDESRAQATQGFIWQIGTSHLAEVVARSRANSFKELAEPKLESWGEWTFTVESPNGYAITFEGELGE